MIPVIPFAYSLEVDELMVEDFVCSVGFEYPVLLDTGFERCGFDFDGGMRETKIYAWRRLVCST